MDAQRCKLCTGGTSPVAALRFPEIEPPVPGLGNATSSSAAGSSGLRQLADHLDLVKELVDHVEAARFVAGHAGG